MRRKVLQITHEQSERDTTNQCAFAALQERYNSLLKDHECLIARHAQTQVQCAEMQYALLQKQHKEYVPCRDARRAIDDVSNKDVSLGDPIVSWLAPKVAVGARTL